MVKVAKTTKATKTKRPMGRPPIDPADLRTERTAMRIHPDLYSELKRAAREAGMNRSLFVERLVINWINMRLEARGEVPLDTIGRRYTDDELERLYQTPPPRLRDGAEDQHSYQLDYRRPRAPAYRPPPAPASPRKK
jgi:hypothetical protein